MRSCWLVLAVVALAGCQDKKTHVPAPPASSNTAGGLVYVPHIDHRATNVTPTKTEPTTPASVPTAVTPKTAAIPVTTKTGKPVDVTPAPPVVPTIKKTEPIEAGDTPLVQGKIALVGPWKAEKLTVGFVGKKADGSQYSNSVGATIEQGVPTWIATETFLPQTTSLAYREKEGISYRHVKLSPGEHLVYLRRDKVVVGWKKIEFKPGDQQVADFSVDLLKLGELTVTLSPAEEPRVLSLIPADFEPGKYDESVFNAANVGVGQTRVEIAGVPAGKYRLKVGPDESAVEVIAGKESAASFVRVKK